MNKKNVVAGLGEIGKPILKLLSKQFLTVGFDVNKDLFDKKALKKYENVKTDFLHICIPFNSKFIYNVKYLFKKFSPDIIVIHSTVKPHTIEKLQKEVHVPVIYSATRGVHHRMLHDLKRYTKFYSIEKNAPKGAWASRSFSKLMKKCGVKTKKMSSPLTLELAKIICDTSYYGWLINYAQLSNMIAIRERVDYDEMWSFADEIHKYLGNRPKMYPGYIGGHCVIPNLQLVNHQTLNIIKYINEDYFKKVPNANVFNKKYERSKKQSYSI